MNPDKREPAVYASSSNFPLGTAEWRRDYTLSDLPRDTEGNILFWGSSHEEFIGYVKWLVDYLYEKAPNIPGDDSASLFVRRCGPDLGIQMLAMNAVFYNSWVYDCECLIYSGTDPLENENEQNESEQNDFESEGDFDSELDSAPMTEYTPDEIEQVRQELADREQSGLTSEDEDHYCDLAWRVPFASLLRSVHERDERIRLVRLFFSFYQEYDRK